MFLQSLLPQKSNKYYSFCECVCSLRNTACNAHVPHRILWPARLYCIFPHSHNLKKILIGIKCVFRFSLQLMSKTLLIVRRTEQDMVKMSKCILVFMKNIHYLCQILMKLEFSRHMFEKYSNIKFHENPSSGSQVVACRRLDRWTHMTKVTVAFCNSVKVPTIHM
jgi:hypothetical protein